MLLGLSIFLSLGRRESSIKIIWFNEEGSINTIL